MAEYITYASLKDLFIEALSVKGDKINAIFRQKDKPKVIIGVTTGIKNRALSITYPTDISLMTGLESKLESTAREVGSKLKEAIEEKTDGE